MKQIHLMLMIITSMYFANTAQAEEVNSLGEAATLCKSHASTLFEDVQRRRVLGMKKRRGKYVVKLAVTTADGKQRLDCTVLKDGTVDMQQK